MFAPKGKAGGRLCEGATVLFHCFLQAEASQHHYELMYGFSQKGKAGGLLFEGAVVLFCCNIQGRGQPAAILANELLLRVQLEADFARELQSYSIAIYRRRPASSIMK